MKRSRWIVIMVSAVLCLGLAGGYFIYVRAQGSSAMMASPESVANPASVRAEPHVVFRNSALGVQVSRTIENPGALKVISTEKFATSFRAFRILTCSPASLSTS